MAKDKKMNPFLFMLIATLFNLVLVLVFFIILTVLVSYLTNVLGWNEAVYSGMIMVAFIASFAGSFLIYKKFVEWATVKWNVDQSLFSRKKR